ncbi:MAG: hypothetical protein EXR79_09435 [Myxococcales bacterium]|nr:hypothetical protein [Myxococcales bacterium]
MGRILAAGTLRRGVGQFKVAGTATSTPFAVGNSPPAGQKLYLRFQAFLDIEPCTAWDKLTVEVSDHGFATPANVSVAVSKASLGAWAKQQVAVTTVAGKPAVQVRFVFDSGDCAVNTGKGVFLDDVVVQAAVVPVVGPVAL